MRRSRWLLSNGLLAALVFVLFASTAQAQLAGTDTSPGDSCAAFPAGATRLTADADLDGAYATLICDGTIWSATRGPDRAIQFNSGGAFGTDANFVFTSAGRLGVGTDNPQATLHVIGNIRTNWNKDDHQIGKLRIEYFQSNNPQLRTSGSYIYLRDHIRLLNDPHIYSHASGHTTDQEFIHRRAGDFGFLVNTSDDSGIGIDRFRVGGGNNVVTWLDNLTGTGIGTAAPQAMLDVAGGVKVANDTAACISAKEGTLRYISGGSPPWQFCDGGSWMDF